jgi:hypothetical protein
VTIKGKIDPSEAGRYEGIQYADGSKEIGGGGDAKMAVKGSEAMNGIMSNGVANGVVRDGLEREGSEEEILRMERERDEQGYPKGQRKKGVLRKMHLHKV